MENEEAAKEAVVDKKTEQSYVYPERTYEFKTELGKAVQSGEIKDIDEILEKHLKILEPQIVDFLLPNLQSDFLYVGQSKGKLGEYKEWKMKKLRKKLL